MRFPVFLMLCLSLLASGGDTDWPEISHEAKPWTRWWWLGSGVDAENLTAQLEAFSKDGIGGVEICPIYGAKGYEERDLKFLSQPWTAAYAHTAKETARLGMGVDLTTGTGWPFGGPWVQGTNASASLSPVSGVADGGKSFMLRLPRGNAEFLSAWPETGESVDLLPHLKGNRLEWMPPDDGEWRIHGLVSRHELQKVKRAAPGGDGWVNDPFSAESIRSYFKPFDAALDRPEVPEPRAHFHDSFEYYGAAWTPDLFERFEQLRGYDLRAQLPAFQGAGDPETVTRVRADYRATMSDLHEEYLAGWHTWAAGRGSLTRNQAHGSPGNLLDHYAVADIPETEIFRSVGEEQIPMLQFASSAAHVTGRKLVSAEAFTWLDEHFQVTPEKLKDAADFIWLAGVNHLFFHGIPYSPADAPWPGWLFYASTHMGPNGGLWADQPAFNTYIARCQSLLQSGAPDNRVLVYFPMHDVLHDGSEGLPLLTVHNQDKWLHPTPFHRLAMELWEAGIPCDFVSDQMLAEAEIANDAVILIPETRHLPLKTAGRLRELAAEGRTVIFPGPLPQDVPGFGDLEIRRKELAEINRGFSGETEVLPALAAQGISGEPMSRHRLRFVRRKHPDGSAYFIVNRSGKAIDERIALATPFASAVFFDPMRGRSGVADPADSTLRIVLAPGESRLLRTYREKQAEGPRWTDLVPAGDPIPLTGTWQVRFLSGGPVLPEPFETDTLGSWTDRDDEAYRTFSGTALYRLELDLPEARAALLDLGEIARTAKVRINGKDAGTCWSPPHRLDVSGHLLDGQNVLEVEVTNLAANRIADLDRRGVPWKAFHEINFVNIDYKPFDASTWEPLPSGLIGPVTLMPLE